MKRKITIFGAGLWLLGYTLNSLGIDGFYVLALGVTGLVFAFYGIIKRV